MFGSCLGDYIQYVEDQIVSLTEGIMIRIKVEAYSVMFKRTKDSYGCLIENCSGWNKIRCFNSISWLPNHQIYSVTNEGIMISYQGWSISDKYKFSQLLD